ncbi:MAG: hypothetical protein P1Q69_18850 [Candidatus Thorarchaeota archaeon]|nr:hypothetical protein [Candidatus Thorarchaeota archaeon]
MSNEDLYEALVRLIGTNVTSEVTEKARDLGARVLSDGLTLSNKQCESIDESLLDMDPELATVIAHILVGANNERFKTLVAEHRSHAGDSGFQMEHYFINILKKKGLLLDDEYPILTDPAIIHFDSRLSSRWGALTLTNRNLVHRGTYSGIEVGNNTLKRLYYDNIENMPCLTYFDFLSYDNIESVEYFWNWRQKKIEIQYRTRYIESKSRTLYGPYFFKAGLPASVKVKEGVLKMEIILMEIPSPDLSEKLRLERVYEILKDLTGL